MSEVPQRTIELSVCAGRIKALWINGVVTWVCDYSPASDATAETLRHQRRITALEEKFNRRGLFVPMIEILNLSAPDSKSGTVLMDEFEPEFLTEADGEKDVFRLGAYVLRVTTRLMPYVDNDIEQPIFGLVEVVPPHRIFEDRIIEHYLRMGGAVIEGIFRSTMVGGRPDDDA